MKHHRWYALIVFLGILFFGLGVMRGYRHDTRVFFPEEFRELPQKEQFAYIRQRAKDAGALSTWRFVQDVWKDARFAREAHDGAHLVGRLLFDEQGIKGISFCTPAFAFGCYHGVFDTAFVKGVEVQEAERACLALAQLGEVASCVHGIGHGIATLIGKSEWFRGLDQCDTLSESDFHKNCYDGMFMELEFASFASLDSPHPWSPCLDLVSRYQDSCIRNRVQVLLEQKGVPVEEIGKQCEEDLSGHQSYICADTAGLVLAQQFHGNVSDIINGCKGFVSGPRQGDCVQGAAMEMVFAGYPGWNEAANRLCLALDEASNTVCRVLVSEGIRLHRRE